MRDNLVDDALVLHVINVENLFEMVAQVDTLLALEVRLVVSHVYEGVLNVGLRPQLGAKEHLKHCLLFYLSFG